MYVASAEATLRYAYLVVALTAGHTALTVLWPCQPRAHIWHRNLDSQTAAMPFSCGWACLDQQPPPSCSHAKMVSLSTSIVLQMFCWCEGGGLSSEQTFSYGNR